MHLGLVRERERLGQAAHERSHPQEDRGLWLTAGLATHVGLAIFEQPERFLVAAASTALAA